MGDPLPGHSQTQAGLQRHFGLLHATALNVSMIVGAGVFVTIPLMLGKLPGPYALLGWLAAGALMLVDGMIWSELGAALPGSGGSYLYLLESFGRTRWGRLMAFLFVWQFLISGPLEVASGLIAAAIFSTAFSSDFADFDKAWTSKVVLWADAELGAIISPSRLAAFAVGLVILALLYRRITTLGRLTLIAWLGVLAVIAWILVEGFMHFDVAVAFDFSGQASHGPVNLAEGLGGAMVLAMYAYLGYYNVCYIGDEVRNPGKTIPRAIFLSAGMVCLLFVGLHLAMLGTVSWHDIPTKSPEVDDYSLPAEFMRRLYGDEEGKWARILVTCFLIWSCCASVFAALLGYSRIPFGAARHGRFFAPLGQVHPVRGVPHVSLLVVGGLTLFWTFFDLQNVINALMTTRILEQFIGQIVGVILLRHRRPDLPRRYRMWLYPLPCALALAGWLYMYATAGGLFIALGLVTLFVGSAVFLAWSWRGRQWPFAPASDAA
jgi:amino acid transporter